MRLDRFDSVDAFLRAAGPFLRTREANHCIILGISANIRARPPDPAEDPPYLATVRDGRRVVLAAFQTPPWPLVISEVDDPAAMEVIVADRRGTTLPAVEGPAEHVWHFARRWSETSGVGHHLAMRERIFRLGRVIAPAGVAGTPRIAGPGDRDILADWLRAFAEEALSERGVPDAATRADRWLSPDDGRVMWLWDDHGPVSLCGVSGPTPTGIRIGPVYTPPEKRRRGYASGLVAAASRSQLEAGRRWCFLFTDLANRTSNHIYEAIGYEPVRDIDRYTFG